MKAKKFERNRGLNFVRYEAFIMPIDSDEFLLMDEMPSKQFNPTYISSVKFTAIGSPSQDNKNGIQAAEKFINNLKKYITTI